MKHESAGILGCRGFWSCSQGLPCTCTVLEDRREEWSAACGCCASSQEEVNSPWEGGLNPRRPYFL